MKKIAVAGLAAAVAFLPVSGAMAQEITPVNPSVSTQELVLFGGLAPGTIILGTVLIGGILYAIIDSSSTSGTN